MSDEQNFCKLFEYDPNKPGDQQRAEAEAKEHYKKLNEEQLFEAFKKINPNDPEVNWAYNSIRIKYVEIEINGYKSSIPEKVNEKDIFDLWLSNHRAKQELFKLIGE